MTYLYKGFLAILFLGISFQSLAQVSSKPKILKHVNYKDNVTQPLTQKEKAQLAEVYADQLDNLILSRPQRLKDIKDILRNRVVIELASANEKSSYAPLLSTVPLFNNYNTTLKRDASFNKNNFNPLKYQFHFHGFSTKMYRIDNTDYLVTIIPQRR